MDIAASYANLSHERRNGYQFVIITLETYRKEYQDLVKEK